MMSRPQSVLADLQNASHTSSPPLPSKVLSRSISARLDGAAQFLNASPPRTDLADQYQAEVKILSEFLAPEPAGMDVVELDVLVAAVLAELGVDSTKKIDGKDVGRVIKTVTERGQGRAPGKLVAEAVRRIGSA